MHWPWYVWSIGPTVLCSVQLTLWGISRRELARADHHGRSGTSSRRCGLVIGFMSFMSLFAKTGLNIVYPKSQGLPSYDIPQNNMFSFGGPHCQTGPDELRRLAGLCGICVGEWGPLEFIVLLEFQKPMLYPWHHGNNPLTYGQPTFTWDMSMALW